MKIIALIAAVAVAEKTRLLVEVCRHGARTSGYVYPLTVNDP